MEPAAARARAQATKLLNLDTINLGFIRPNEADDRQMAYCQAQLYARYMLKRFGKDALIKMLSAYRRGLTTDRAIDACFHVDKADFEKGYLAYLDEVIKTIRTRVSEEPVSFSVLERQVKEKPDDPDLNAQMAYEHFARRDLKAARPFADKALKLKPHHPLASYVKAQLMVTIGDDDAGARGPGAGTRPGSSQRESDRPAGRAQDESRPARRSREALRAGPQGRPDPHQVDFVAGADSPAAEEDRTVPRATWR